MTTQLNEDPISPFLTRQERLFELLLTSGLDALALNPGPSLHYLTGLNFHLMERPIVAFFIPGNPILFVLPELEAGRAAGVKFPVQTYTYGDNPQTWKQAFDSAAQAGKIDKRAIGIEPRRLRVLELRFLEAAAPGARFISAETSLATLRIQKGAEEISAMRIAVDIAQRALQATLPQIKVGMTERELASELTLQLLRAGAAPEAPFSPIISSGPNSANPHATPTDRRLTPGDLLVIDWGATHDGYLSDLTRTFAIGKVEPEFEHIAQVVQQANAAGRAIAQPGLAAGEVDRAARQVIEQAGYGPYFFHRVGHGIGLEEHEEPYMYAENPLVLAPGMAFTVEPGIYLTGRGGIRIEDDVVITVDGVETLSSLPRELITIEP